MSFASEEWKCENGLMNQASCKKIGTTWNRSSRKPELGTLFEVVQNIQNFLEQTKSRVHNIGWFEGANMLLHAQGVWGAKLGSQRQKSR
jgi:hypothetical protein